MAATRKTAPVDPPAIDTIDTKSRGKPTRRSARNVLQTKGEESSAVVPIVGKRGDGDNEVSRPGSETIAPATLPEDEEVTATKASGADACGVKGQTGKSGVKGKRKEEVSEKWDDSIRCFCQNKVEKGEMVCCEACSGWFHLKCMGMKEGADVMKGKDFVCHFCASSIVLSMREEIMGLRRELNGVKNEMKKMLQPMDGEKEAREGSVRSELKETRDKQKRGRAGGEGSGRQRCNECGMDKQKGGRAEGNERQKERGIDAGKQMSGGTGGKGSGRQKEGEVGKQKSTGKGTKRVVKWASGVRKVWGTRKKESCDEVAKEMVRVVGKMGSGFSVRKQVAELGGKKGWWFIVKAPERCLVEVDEKWNHKHWQWQKVRGGGNDFLGVAPVSAGHR